MVVASTENIHQILATRLVNKRMFDHEITDLFGRTRLHGCIGSDNQDAIDRTPHDFKIRMLQSYLGNLDRKDNFFASKMHAVADFLWENLEGKEKPTSRDELVKKICEGLVTMKYYHHIVGNDPSPKPKAGYRVGVNLLHRTTFALAVAMRLHNLQKSMNERGIGSIKSGCKYFGYPLDIALRIDDDAAVRILYKTRRILRQDESPATEEGYCKNSSKKGHKNNKIERGSDDFFEHILHKPLILVNAASECQKEIHLGIMRVWRSRHGPENLAPWRISRVDNILENVFTGVMEKRRWDLVMGYLKECPNTHSQYLKELFLMNKAAHEGRGDIVSELINARFQPRQKDDRTFIPRFLDRALFACEGAVRNNHLDICKLIFQGFGISPQRHDAITLSLWHTAIEARSPTIFEFLKREGYTGPWCGTELPFAIERGCLGIAKYVLKYNESNEDGQIEDGERQNSSSLCSDFHFLLLRATVNNHLDIVQRLIGDLKVDPNNMPSKWVDMELDPLTLAVDSGHREMAQLLLRLGTTPLDMEDFEAETSNNYRKARMERFQSTHQDMWRQDTRKPTWDPGSWSQKQRKDCLFKSEWDFQINRKQYRENSRNYWYVELDIKWDYTGKQEDVEEAFRAACQCDEGSDGSG